MKSTLFSLALAGMSSMVDASPVAMKSRSVAAKRGLAFPKQYAATGAAGSTYTHNFASYPQVSWMYDWEAVIDGEALDLEYVPLLHSSQTWCTEGWFANVAAAQKKYKVSHVLSFNEPDQQGGGGAGMTVSDAVSTHQKFIQPLAEQGLRIGSPAVTNGIEADKGLNYLSSFMSGCSNCQIDFVVAHWYSWANADDFKAYFTNMYKKFNKPIWITEFGVTEGDCEAFLKEVLPWLDQQAWIERYAYYMAAPATGTEKFLINASGNGLTSIGEIYASTPSESTTTYGSY